MFIFSFVLLAFSLGHCDILTLSRKTVFAGQCALWDPSFLAFANDCSKCEEERLFAKCLFDSGRQIFATKHARLK